jgi:hypothetical protein
MRSKRFRYSILLFLGLAAFILNACAPGADPVVPDTYVPPTLQVIVTINEDQDASDGKYGSSMVTLQFITNEIQGGNFVTFSNQESIKCNGINLNLGSFGSSVTTYSVHMIIPNNPPEYYCDYYYPQDKSKPARIFTVPVLSQLMPKLQRPVASSSDIKVSYNPDNKPPHDCQVQVTANGGGQSATGNSVQEDGGMYLGPNVGSLSGPGNLVMTRTCMPPKDNYDHHNANDDAGSGCQTTCSSSTFDKLNLTYKSTASYEVSWVPPNTSPTSAS